MTRRHVTRRGPLNYSGKCSIYLYSAFYIYYLLFNRTTPIVTTYIHTYTAATALFRRTAWQWLFFFYSHILLYSLTRVYIGIYHNRMRICTCAPSRTDTRSQHTHTHYYIIMVDLCSCRRTHLRYGFARTCTCKRHDGRATFEMSQHTQYYYKLSIYYAGTYGHSEREREREAENMITFTYNARDVEGYIL